MNYPVWELFYTGGGFWIALISVVHVYVAHFAVGGGLFLVITEIRGYHRSCDQTIAYVKRHSRFFLLLTMVFGAVTGVGIWFIIGLVSPQVTSALIHIFVFAWATEWVFFLGEIVALFLYHYRFGKMARRDHLMLGWFYFIFAWLSLFMVNGILCFMLSPGQWPQSGRFWDGFFNETTWAALFYRTMLAFFLAGLFSLVTAVFEKDGTFRKGLLRYAAKWVFFGAAAMLPASLLYYEVLPEMPRSMIMGGSAETVASLGLFIWILPAILVLTAMLTRTRGDLFKRVLVFVILFAGLGYMGSFEWIRESSRRPYLVHGEIWSNAIATRDAETINQEGILQTAKWVRSKVATEENAVSAGRDIFQLECAACHSIGGPMNDILPLTAKFSPFGMEAFLRGLGKIGKYMPPFVGTGAERKALARYITEELHPQKPLSPKAPQADIAAVEMPAFEADSQYVLLAWSTRGLRMLSDAEPVFSLQLPGNDIYALLIRRGTLPEIVTENVSLFYSLESDFLAPSEQIDFWKHAFAYLGQQIPLNTGISGKGTLGDLELQENGSLFVTKGIPVVPYTRKGTFQPLPAVTVAAVDKETNRTLCETRVVSAASTQWGCRNCHGGEWKRGSVTGISDKTAMDILTVHDRISKTELSQQNLAGSPIRCVSCHSRLSTDDSPGEEVLNLSAAIHGFHALFLTNLAGDACTACHPSSENSIGGASRGIHAQLGMGCVNCHGTMEDHALSLLAGEVARQKPSAAGLAALIAPRSVGSAVEMAPRRPWTEEPDCLHCHVDFQPPETDEAEPGHWTAGKEELFSRRMDDAGIPCAACHSSPHVLYPASHRRDNLQALQYQQEPYPIAANRQCRVCHTVDMEDEMHHPNSLAEFRNTM